MRRVWAEHITPRELRDPTVLDLLRRFDIHPILAVHPETDLGQLSGWLADTRSAGLEPGLWPLLTREEGYWPSERNVGSWQETVRRLLDELQTRGAMPSWLAVDLEPPIGQVARLLRRPIAVPLAALELTFENMELGRYRRAQRELRSATQAIQRRGIRVLGVTLPLAAHDLAGRSNPPFWQDMFETPWEGIGWDSAGIMAYGSIVSGASRGVFSPRDARAMHQRLLERVSITFGGRAHASVGITGAGVFGDEPAYTEPGELRRDISAARAAGIEDIAVFCLEGILARDAPEVWFGCFRDAQPVVPPQTWRSQIVRTGGATLRRVGRLAFRR